MKYVTFAELLASPAGTIFQEFGKQGLSEPQVFGDAFGANDFTCAQLFPSETGPEVFGSYREQYVNKHGCEDAKWLVYYPSGFGRDGLYNDDNRHFVIWEDADRRKFAEWLLNPEAADEMNDDPMAMISVPIDDRMS